MKAKLIMAACVLALSACSGGDNNENNGATNNGATNNGATNNGATNNGATNNGATNNGATNNGATNNGATNNGATNNGAGADMGGGDDMGGTADMGGGETHLEAHGCTFETATDMTGNAAVSVSDNDDWVIGHNTCMIVTTGTVVSWTGNFSSHPLDGGVDGTEDTSSPIDMAADGANGNTTVDVTFDTAGDYAYYCAIHVGSMKGVIYVVD